MQVDAQALSPRAEQLRNRWLSAGAQRAGIDLTSWDPARGYEANRDQIHKVPRYYASMFLANPHFEWFMMGGLAAAQFIAGMQDAAEINEDLDGARRTLESIPGPVGDALRAAVQVSGMGGLQRMESRLVSMQKQIFSDQAMMHEAYLGGGMDAIRELRDVELIDDAALDSWKTIDAASRSGDRDLLHEGTTGLVWREQMQIIDDDYDAMRADGLAAPALTYGLTALGTVSIPGARAPREFDPLKVGPVTLPLPGMDISRREDRWALLEGDTVKALWHLLDDDREMAVALLKKDVEKRIVDEGLRNGILGLPLVS